MLQDLYTWKPKHIIAELFKLKMLDTFRKSHLQCFLLKFSNTNPQVNLRQMDQWYGGDIINSMTSFFYV